MTPTQTIGLAVVCFICGAFASAKPVDSRFWRSTYGLIAVLVAVLLAALLSP